MFAAIDTPVPVNGKQRSGTTVVLREGTIMTNSIGTCRTVKDTSEATAVEPYQRKPIFLQGSLVDIPLGDGGVTEPKHSDDDTARPPYVFDTHENGGDWRQPAVAGFLYCAGLTCAEDPYFILSQHTIRGNFPTYIKLLQLILERDLTLEELARQDELVRQSVNISDRFCECSFFPIEWVFGWDMFDQDIAGNPLSAGAVACHCYSGRGNHSRAQR